MAFSTIGAVFGVFRIFVKNCVIHFVMSKKCPEQMSGSSHTYLFNSNYYIDPSTMVIRH